MPLEIPNVFAVGDDLRFQANRVTSGRNATLQPAAALTYRLVNKRSRVVIDSGNMALYDAVSASFAAFVAKEKIVLPDVVPNERYELEIIVNANGVTTTQRKELCCVLDNIVENQINIPVPGSLVIGDDLPFRALGIGSGNSSIVTYTLLNELTRVVKASGTMFRYINNNYEAVISDSLLGSANIEEANTYILQVKINDGGFISTICARLVAKRANY